MERERWRKIGGERKVERDRWIKKRWSEIGGENRWRKIGGEREMEIDRWRKIGGGGKMENIGG